MKNIEEGVIVKKGAHLSYYNQVGNEILSKDADQSTLEYLEKINSNSQTWEKLKPDPTLEQNLFEQVKFQIYETGQQHRDQSGQEEKRGDQSIFSLKEIYQLDSQFLHTTLPTVCGIPHYPICLPFVPLMYHPHALWQETY